MEYQLDERTRDMRNMLESCQTKVSNTLSTTIPHETIADESNEKTTTEIKNC